jgi:DivIVA domain-containing protein
MSVMSQGGRLTPDFVQSVSFPRARLGRRGFDVEHVRAFCGRVETELALLLSERTALEEEVSRLRRRLLRQAADQGGPGRGGRGAHVQAVGILSRARQTADQYVSDAQEYSRHVTADARRQRDEILAQAWARAAPELDGMHDDTVRAVPRP